MKRWFLFTLFPIVLLIVLFTGSPRGWTETASSMPYNPASKFGHTPLYFIPNRGQVDRKALYYARTPGYTLWMTRNGMTPKRGRDVSRLLFLNANNSPQVKPGKAASSSVYYKGLYKNIDLKIYGVQKKIEYDWNIHPGGNPEHILIRYEGIKSSKIDDQGNLRIDSARKQWPHRNHRQCLHRRFL